MDKLAQYLQYLQLDPTNEMLLITVADMQHQQGKFDEAESTLRTLLAQQPEHEIALSRLASVLISLQKYHDAQQLLAQLPQAEPVVQYNHAICDFYLGNFNTAQQQFSELTNSPILAAGSHQYLATLAFASGDTHQALSSISKARVSDNPNAQYLAGLEAQVYFYDGDTDKAVNLALAEVKSGNSNGDVLDVLGQYYLANGEYEQAQQQFEQAIAAVENDHRALHGLAIVNWQCGNAERAEQLLQQVTAAQGAQSNYQFTLALFYISQQQFAKASEVLDNMQGEQLADAYGAQALCALMQGNFSAANEYIDQALKLDTHSIFGLYAKAIMDHLNRNPASTQKLAARLDQPLVPGGHSISDMVLAMHKRQTPYVKPSKVTQ